MNVQLQMETDYTFNTLYPLYSITRTW